MNHRHCKIFRFLSGLFLIFLLHTAAYGQTYSEADKDRIDFSADSLEVDNQDRSAVLSGSVRISQGTTVIRSDRLKIFYKDAKSGKIPKEKKTGEDSIRRIEAYGSVEIAFDGHTALTGEAIYTTEDRILVLQGPDTKLITGKSTLSGSRITIDRNKNKTMVEGATGIYFPEDGKGIR